jgi:dTMP kinase
MKGKFITFEGIDGSGKDTQLELLGKELELSGFDVCYTRQPGGTSFGEKLRDLVKSDEPRGDLTELLTFQAGYAEAKSLIIEPHLEKGDIVLCNRYFDSALAYQGFGRGMDIDLIKTFNSYTTVKPDLTLLFDVPLEEAHSTEQAYFEKLGMEYMNRVRNGYLELAREDPDRIKVIQRFPAKTVEESIEKTFQQRTLPHVLGLLEN